MKLIWLGAPGAGKQHAGRCHSRELGIPGDFTGNTSPRAAIQEGTPTGMKAKTYMDEGHRYPMRSSSASLKSGSPSPIVRKRFILDGVPRTIAQAEALEAAGIKFRIMSSPPRSLTRPSWSA